VNLPSLLKVAVLPLAIGSLLALSALPARASTTFSTGAAGMTCADSDGGLGGSSCPSGDAGAYTLGSSLNGVTGFGLDTTNQFVTGDNHEISCDSTGTECTETVTITDTVTATGTNIAGSTTIPISWDFIVGADGDGTLRIVSYTMSLTLTGGPAGTGFTATKSATTVGTTIDTGSTDQLTGTVNGTTSATNGIEAGHTYTATSTIVVTYYQTPAEGHEVQIAVEVPDTSVDFGSSDPAAPEPASVGLCGLGLAALGWIGKRVPRRHDSNGARS
jgi:hypothetical protein